MDPHEKKEILDAINNSHQATYQAFHDLFENSIKAFSEQLGQFEERNSLQHHDITDRQDITNGRVGCLEKETELIRWAVRNPKSAILITIILMAGVVALVLWLGLETTIKFI